MQEAKIPLSESLAKAMTFVNQAHLAKGWGYTLSNKQPFIEPSAWCILFLGFSNPNFVADIEFLIKCQNHGDGGWPNSLGAPSDIRTANVVLVLNELDRENVFKSTLEKGIKWLLDNRKGNDGWAWSPNAWNFTEPTSLAILALLKSNPEIIPSVKNYILRFQCQDGGWNSHAKSILGTPQASTPSVTPWALIALQHMGALTNEAAISQAITYLRIQFYREKLSSPYSLGLSLYALLKYDAEHKFQSDIVKALIKLQSHDGNWGQNLWWTSLIGIALRTYIENEKNPSQGGK